MKKKSWILISVLVVGVAATLVWWFLPKQLMHINADDVAEIVIFNGNTGELLEFSDSERISEIINTLNDVKLVKKYPHIIVTSGFAYELKITLNDGTICRYNISGKDRVRLGLFAYGTQNSFIFTEYFSQFSLTEKVINTDLISQVGQPFNYFKEKYGWQFADLEPSIYEGPPVGEYVSRNATYVFNDYLGYDSLTEETPCTEIHVPYTDLLPGIARGALTEEKLTKLFGEHEDGYDNQQIFYYDKVQLFFTLDESEKYEDIVRINEVSKW